MLAQLAETGVDAWLRQLRSLRATRARLLAAGALAGAAPGRANWRRARRRCTAIGWLVGMAHPARRRRARWPLSALLRVHGVNADAYLLGPLLVLGLGAGITEEIISRGILFRVVEEGSAPGSRWCSPRLLFGLGHIANPNATLLEVARDRGRGRPAARHGLRLDALAVVRDGACTRPGTSPRARCSASRSPASPSTACCDSHARRARRCSAAASSAPRPRS